MEPIMPMTIDKTTETLDKLLELELAAAATYEAALEHLTDPKKRVALELNRMSHVTRASTLGQLVRSHGGVPSQSSSAWLSLSKLAERGASLFGDDAIISLLVEGEKALSSKMQMSLDTLDDKMRTIVYGDIIADHAKGIERIEAAAHS